MGQIKEQSCRESRRCLKVLALCYSFRTTLKVPFVQKNKKIVFKTILIAIPISDPSVKLTGDQMVNYHTHFAGEMGDLL